MEVVLRAVMGNDRLRVTDVFTQQNAPNLLCEWRMSEYTVPKDVDTEQEGMGKNRENTVQMKILSGTKKTFS